jgi:hypothetical protein
MAEHAVTNSGLQLTDSTYDTMRLFVEKVFPAAGVLYALLASFWGWGHVVEVTGTLAGVAVFLGVLLSFARKGYSSVELPASYDGQVVQTQTDAGDTVLRVQLNSEATADLFNKPVINIKGFDASA